MVGLIGTNILNLDLCSVKESISLGENESKVIEIREVASDELENIGVKNGLIQIDLRQGPTDYSTPLEEPLPIEIEEFERGRHRY